MKVDVINCQSTFLLPTKFVNLIDLMNCLKQAFCTGILTKELQSVEIQKGKSFSIVPSQIAKMACDIFFRTQQIC